MQMFLRSLALFASAIPFIAQADIVEQRKLFQETYRQLNAGKPVDIKRIAKRLGDYPLTPYLEYGELRRDLRTAQAERLERFLSAQPELAVSPGLRQSYLEHLGKVGKWRQFNALYQPSGNIELQCYQLRSAQQLEGTSESWLTSADAIWRADLGLSKVCAPVVQVLFDRKLLTEADVWEQVVRLMAAGDSGGAERLRPRLSKGHQTWLARWLKIDRQPKQTLKPDFALDSEEARLIVAHGLRRLARGDAEQALQSLNSPAFQKVFSALERAQLQRDIVLQFAYSQDPAALALLDSLPDEVVTEEVRLWRARMALRMQDWPRLLTAISALSLSEREDSQWRYWRGHALEATGVLDAARDVLGPLALERNYYGFLAADRLNLPYNMEHAPARFSDEELAAVAADPGIRRAEEFFQLGMMPDARREWQAAVERFDNDQKARAALLAFNWGWYDRAVFTANSAGLDNALNLRFPMPYRQQVEHYSRQHRLDPQVTYAILRKESAFRADAVSRVGAMGLMQVMPETGRRVAQGMKVKLPSKYALLEVDTNLKLGSAYLRAMLDRYSGNLVLAAAAYNAGPHRVTDWLVRNADLPPTVWIEAISFYETRDYVKSILAFATVFEWQLNGESRRLTDYLLPLHDTVACAAAQAEGSCRRSS